MVCEFGSMTGEEKDVEAGRQAGWIMGIRR